MVARLCDVSGDFTTIAENCSGLACTISEILTISNEFEASNSSSSNAESIFISECETNVLEELLSSRTD